MEGMGWEIWRESEPLTPTPAGLPHPPTASLKAPHSMVAAFDYNPRESSPNMDAEVRACWSTSGSSVPGT